MVRSNCLPRRVLGPVRGNTDALAVPVLIIPMPKLNKAEPAAMPVTKRRRETVDDVIRLVPSGFLFITYLFKAMP